MRFRTAMNNCYRNIEWHTSHNVEQLLNVQAKLGFRNDAQKYLDSRCGCIELWLLIYYTLLLTVYPLK